MAERNVPNIGIHANAWNNVLTGVNTNSKVIDTWSCPFVDAFGHVDGATTLTLMLSQDSTSFYAGPTITLGGASDFVFDPATIAARYIALQSTANVTATATITAK